MYIIFTITTRAACPGLTSIFFSYTAAYRVRPVFEPPGRKAAAKQKNFVSKGTNV